VVKSGKILFDITYATLQDNKKFKEIAKTILMFSKHYEDSCKLVEENHH